MRTQLADKKETTFMSNIYSLLPPEIIFEILSRLPVKFLLRMRCVCKNWYNLTQDRYFIEKQINKGHSWYSYNIIPAATSTSAFVIIYGSDGLLLVRSTATGKYSITNEAIKQTLLLPDPPKNSFGMVFSFVPSIGQYKIVSLYDTNKQGTFSESCLILTAGIDNSWRTLKIAKLDNVNKKSEMISVVAAGGVVHYIMVSKIGSSNICREILSLDLESERLTHVVLPQDLFPYGSEVRPLNWNGKLAFAYRMQKDLNVLVLESYNKLKWGVKKIVVSLQFESNEAILLNNLIPVCQMIYGSC